LSDVDDEARRRAQFLLETIEARRAQSDTFAWTVPGLAIAGQAFILSIALGPDTQPAGRLVASLAGLLALVATMHLMAKQAYNFDVYEAVIERERKTLSLPGVQMDALTAKLGSFPENTQLVKRGWLDERKHRWRGSQRLVRRLKAVTMWLSVLGCLAVIDLALLGYSIGALFSDPGLL
jgi:hypothetical protein